MPHLVQTSPPAPGRGACDAPGQAGRSHRLLALGVACVVTLLLAVLAPQLIAIERAAETTRGDVIPDMVIQQKRTVWTESLRSAANLVVYAPERSLRRDALSKAEQLAANLLRGADANRRAVVAQGLAAIRLAAETTDEAERLDQDIRSMLAEANQVIGDMSANLSSIVEDSAGTLARLLKEVMDRERNRRPTRQDLEEMLAINTTSQDLLAHLDRGRILLTAARSIEAPAELRAAAERFRAINRHLRARVSTLRGNSDYEYLPDMIEHFVALEAVFDRRAAALQTYDRALEASREAKLQLARLRENLAADAAGTAETSVATIAERARQIRDVALAGLGAGVLVAAGIVLYGRQKPGAALGTSGIEAALSPEERRRQEHLARAGELVRRYHQAQRNLDYWRNFLDPKLRRTIAAVLTGSLPDDEQPEVEWPLAAIAEVSAPAPDEVACLPDPLPELIEGIGVQLLALIDRTADLGMTALSDCIAAAVEPVALHPDEHGDAQGGAEPAPEVHPEAPLLRLEAVSGTAEQTVMQIGLCLADINALASAAEASGSPTAAPPETEPLVHRLQGLFEELVVARERLDAGDLEPA